MPTVAVIACSKAYRSGGLDDALDRLDPVLVLHGDTTWADRRAWEWARLVGVVSVCHEARWSMYGSGAADVRDALLLLEAGRLMSAGNRVVFIVDDGDETSNLSDGARSLQVEKWQLQRRGRWEG